LRRSVAFMYAATLSIVGKRMPKHQGPYFR
jgi:hypothetical protein